MVSAQSTTAEKVPVTITPRLPNKPDGSPGDPAPVDGPLTFDIIDGAATVQYDPANQLAFFVVSEDVAGISHVRVNADADMGAGVVTISEVIEYTYAAPQAASLGVAVGAPVPK